MVVLRLSICASVLSKQHTENQSTCTKEDGLAKQGPRLVVFEAKPCAPTVARVFVHCHGSSPPGGGQVLEFEWCLPTLSDMDLDAYAPSASSSAAGTSGGACGMSGFGDISSLRLPPTLLPGQKFGDYYTVRSNPGSRIQSFLIAWMLSGTCQQLTSSCNSCWVAPALHIYADKALSKYQLTLPTPNTCMCLHASCTVTQRHFAVQVAFVMDNREQMSRHSNYGRTLKRGEELETHTTVLKEQGVPVSVWVLPCVCSVLIGLPWILAAYQAFFEGAGCRHAFAYRQAKVLT